MNLRKSTVLPLLSAAALVAGALASSIADARPGGRHFHHGGRAFFYAAPIVAAGLFASRYYYPPTYYYPPYYYPPAVYYPPSPPVYIERPQVQPQPQYQPAPQPQPQYQPEPQYQQPQPQSQAEPPAQARSEQNWYFCAESQGYYPQVRECPGGWQRLAPRQPPG